MRTKHLLIIVALAFTARLTLAAGPAASASVDKTQVTIGDRVRYTVTLNVPPGAALLPREKETALGPWEVKDVRTATPENGAAAVTYTLAAYTTGQLAIPPLAFRYRDAEQRTVEVRTGSVTVTVDSVLARFPQAGDIRDIKPPFTAPVPWYEYLLWLALIAALAGGLYRWFKRKGPAHPASEAPQAPAIPPEQLALERLQQLKDSSLLADGLVKEFYSALADIIRDYLAAVFKIETRDRTTAEIYIQFKGATADKRLLAMVKDLFEECDLVKFARYRPEEAACLTDWETAKTIVDVSRPSSAAHA